MVRPAESTADAVRTCTNPRFTFRPRFSFASMNMSARAYDKILKVARTIADLDGQDEIDILHISEAVQYRSLDRKFRR